MNIVQIILENLAQLLPFQIIMSYQHGVRWTFGIKPTALPPGFRWRVPGVHRISTVGNVPEVIDLTTQTVVTSDGKTITFGANMGYVVEDPVKHFCEVYNFTDSVRALAAIHLSVRVREKSSTELDAESLKKLEASLTNTLTTRLSDWGTRVTHVGFTDFAITRPPIRIYQDARSVPAA
jgi:regulator of protease activity HflC (stomatin/prohibitin superfamily)